MATTFTTLASFYYSREQELKKEIASFDRNFMQSADLPNLAASLAQKYLVKEIKTCGECQITTREKQGFDADGKPSKEPAKVTVIARFPVSDDPEVINLIEMMKARVYSPAKSFKYIKGVIEMEATVEPSAQNITTEHLKLDLEKRNRIIRTENAAFQKRIPSLLLAARNEILSLGRRIHSR